MQSVRRLRPLRELLLQQCHLSHDFSLIESPGAQPIVALARRNQHTASCDGCAHKVEGTHYKCKSCDDFNFYQDCYAKKPHNPSHLFKAIEYPGANPISLPARSWLHPPNPQTRTFAAIPSSRPEPSTSNNTNARNSYTHQTPSVSNLSPPPPPYDVSVPFPQVKIDDTVLLSGLNRAEMNGKSGKVVSIDLVAERAEVYIEDLGSSFKVRFENVTVDTTSAKLLN